MSEWMRVWRNFKHKHKKSTAEKRHRKVEIEQEKKTERKELLFWVLINRSYW